MEMNNLYEMGDDKLGSLWSEMGAHWCTLEYVGLEYMVRTRYIGERVQAFYASGLLTAKERKWVQEKGGNIRVSVLDFSYAYGWTRKGTLVRVRASNPGLPYQIHTIRRDVAVALEEELVKACRAAGKDPAALKITESMSFTL